MLKILFMGTPEFALPSLEALLSDQIDPERPSSEMPIKIVGVITQPDRPAGRGQAVRKSPVKLRAEAADIPVFQPKNLRGEASFERVKEWDPDVIVVAAFGQILPTNILDYAAAGSVNVHASLLPRWRGASPIQHAILAGDSESGVTLMKMEAGLDTGPVYVQESIFIEARETAATLHDKLAALGGLMLGRHLNSIVKGMLAPQDQDDSSATYAPLVKKDAGLIDWGKNSASIDRQVRAMTPWPGAFTSWQGKIFKVLSARPVEIIGSSGCRPGDVVVEAGSIIVAAGEGGLALCEVQLAGKRRTAIKDFVRGYPNLVGSQLGQ